MVKFLLLLAVAAAAVVLLLLLFTFATSLDVCVKAKHQCVTKQTTDPL